MSRVRVLVLPLVAAAAVWTATSAGASPNQQIRLAALAPYAALAQRDSAAMCAAFTPSVAARLVVNAPPGASCPTAVAHLFTAAPADPLPPAGRLLRLLTVTQVMSRGNLATAVLHYLNVSIASIVLRRSGGAWRIATRARLGLDAACIIGSAANGGGGSQGVSTPGAGSCPPNSRQLQFVVGQLTPVSGSLDNEGQSIPIPVAVQRAGGRELSEFVAGAEAFAQSGCEGCHQLAGQGNEGPGPALDGIGSRVSKRQLVQALADPRAPMPSFKNLPQAKFQALVTFLSLLKSS